MDVHEGKMTELVSLLDQYTPQEGYNQTILDNVVTFRASEAWVRTPVVYEPAVVIMGQGTKYCFAGKRAFDYSAGNYLALFLPMPLEVIIEDATPEHPVLMVGFRLNLQRIASLLLKLDSIDRSMIRQEHSDPSGIYAAPLNNGLLDPTIRLLQTLSDPTDAAMLGEALLDEICYRLLRDERAGALRFLLQQQEQIKQISRAVDYIHQNLDQPVSVEELASSVNMSMTSFHRSFKAVMHVSPLQYAKSMKLHKAQALILEGKRANEAGYLVGYNSPAQFSREYKRQFGYVPSAT